MPEDRGAGGQGHPHPRQEAEECVLLGPQTLEEGDAPAAQGAQDDEEGAQRRGEGHEQEP